MEKTKMEVKINGMEYTIVSNEPEEYVQRVALMVNKRIGEVKEVNPHLSTAMLAVMASMNLADDYIKSETAADKLRDEISAYTSEIYTGSAELEDKKLEVESLKEELHKLEIELAKRETELENMRAAAARAERIAARSESRNVRNAAKTMSQQGMNSSTTQTAAPKYRTYEKSEPNRIGSRSDD